MTLILSCVTRDYAVQVSDRCLTDLASGRPLEQESNKAVVLSNRVAFAYTGLARIEGKPADIWLRDVLTPHQSMRHAVQLVVDEATRAFAQMPASPAAKRQAFVAVGWAHFPDVREDLSPFGLTISNALTQEGRWLPGAMSEFSGQGKVLKGPDSGFLWTHAGGLSDRRGAALNRAIGRVASRGLGPAAVSELLVREIREVADEPGSRVGRGLMVNCIPRAATGSDDLFALSSMPTNSELCFAHLRHDGSLEPTEGPHFVRPGGRLYSNFKAWREGDAELVQVDFKSG